MTARSSGDLSSRGLVRGDCSSEISHLFPAEPIRGIPGRPVAQTKYPKAERKGGPSFRPKPESGGQRHSNWMKVAGFPAFAAMTEAVISQLFMTLRIAGQFPDCTRERL